MKQTIKLNENDLRKLVGECVNRINENDEYMTQQYQRLYACIHKLCDALLGPDYIAGDTCDGVTAAENITNEIIRKYGKGRGVKPAQEDDEIPVRLKEAVDRAVDKYLSK